MGRPSKPHLHATGVWRFRFRGDEYYAPSEAEAWRKLLALGAEESQSSAPPETVLELIDRFRRHHPSQSAREKLVQFGIWARGRALPRIDADILADFDRHLLSNGYSAWSRISWVGYARAVLHWGIARHFVDGPIHDAPLPAQPRQPKALTTAQLAAVFAEIDSSPRSRAAARLLRFIVATGCRPGEACAMCWEQIDLRSKVIHLADHKTAHATGRIRTIYLTPLAVKVLSELQPQPKGPVWRSRKGPYTVGGLRSTFRSAARRALGVREIGTYVLRHTFAAIVSRQVPMDELARLMGHRSVVTTQRYYEIDDPRARAAAAQVDVPVQSPHVALPPEKDATRAAPRQARHAQNPTRPANDRSSRSRKLP